MPRLGAAALVCPTRAHIAAQALATTVLSCRAGQACLWLPRVGCTTGAALLATTTTTATISAIALRGSATRMFAYVVLLRVKASPLAPTTAPSKFVVI